MRKKSKSNPSSAFQLSTRDIQSLLACNSFKILHRSSLLHLRSIRLNIQKWQEYKVLKINFSITEWVTLEQFPRKKSLETVSFDKAGYTATQVACGREGAILEVTSLFGQEQ